MDEGDVGPDPLAQLAEWLDAARHGGDAMPDAMCLATAGGDGAPAARLVLLRGLDSGLVFFTDYGSDKARELEANPRAAAVLHFFVPRHRQVRAAGRVMRTTTTESDRYWDGRPVGSRRSAVASHQSSVVASRADLERAVAAVGPEPPRPDRWGGFRLVPETVELWEEGPDRLHDRIRYVRSGDRWRTERLSP